MVNHGYWHAISLQVLRYIHGLPLPLADLRLRKTSVDQTVSEPETEDSHFVPLSILERSEGGPWGPRGLHGEIAGKPLTMTEIAGLHILFQSTLLAAGHTFRKPQVEVSWTPQARPPRLRDPGLEVSG